MPYSNAQTGMGINALGGVISTIASALAAVNANKALKSGLNAQQQYARQAMGSLNQSLPGWSAETARGQIAEGSAKRQEAYGAANRTQSSVSKAPKADARDAAAGQMAGQRMANLSGYSDWQIAQMLNKIKAQEQINRISNLAVGTGNLLPAQVENAGHSMDWMGALGQGTSAVGNVYGMWDFLKPASGVSNSTLQRGLMPGAR